MKKRMATIAAALTVGLVAGCGGGESTPAAQSTVSGAVADGYLVGATVFLDKNGDYRLDSGEPSAITDATGAYTLTVDPADVGLYPIVALAIKDVTVDLDAPDQKIAYSYILSLPKESVSGTVGSNFISPMSTQIRELLATGNYTMTQAMDELRARLGLPDGVNVMTDYMARPNDASFASMHDSARNMAGLMGGQMAQVFGANGETVDVNRYRGMMGAIFSDISSVRGSNPTSQTAMLELRETMMAELPTITPGLPFMNMSTAFRGGMTGRGGSMMGR